jgi:hypothetical protein
MFCSQKGAPAAAEPEPKGVLQLVPRADTREREPRATPTSVRTLENIMLKLTGNWYLLELVEKSRRKPGSLYTCSTVEQNGINSAARLAKLCRRR